MSGAKLSVWDSLRRWNSTVFFVAGGVIAILAALWAAEVFMDMDVRLVRNFVGPTGMAVAFVGLLGLYPALADRTPKLARAGALFAVIGILGTVVRAGVAGTQLIGIIDAKPAWLTYFQLSLLIGIILGFITFGVAVLRTDAYSRTVGMLLLIPGILFPVVLGSVIAFGDGSFPYVIHVIHNSTDALVLLAVGYLLHLNGVQTGRLEPTPDTTQG